MYGILADHDISRISFAGIQYEKYLEELRSDHTGYVSPS